MFGLAAHLRIKAGRKSHSGHVCALTLILQPHKPCNMCVLSNCVGAGGAACPPSWLWMCLSLAPVRVCVCAGGGGLHGCGLYEGRWIDEGPIGSELPGRVAAHWLIQQSAHQVPEALRSAGVLWWSGCPAFQFLWPPMCLKAFGGRLYCYIETPQEHAKSRGREIVKHRCLSPQRSTSACPRDSHMGAKPCLAQS